MVSADINLDYISRAIRISLKIWKPFVWRVVWGAWFGLKGLIMNMRKFGLVALAGTVALIGASAANATVFHTYHPGDGNNFYLTSGDPFSPSITANFGDGFSSAVSFDDKFEFIIPQNGTGSGSISTSFSSLKNKLTITDLLINGVSYTVPSNSSGQFLSVNDIPILIGATNTIEVIGSTAARGGTFSGTLTFSAAAVPEAATWGMMLAGFGMVGGAMRRRRQSVAFA